MNITRLRIGFLLALFGTWLPLASPARGAADAVTVAAAISLKEAVTDAAKAYREAGGGEVTFVFGASGELMAQIKNGAPVDAFISAANKQVDDLSKAGLVDDASRRVVAGNRLVLIVPPGAAAPPASFKDLTDAKVKRVAIGEPRTVPAGQYAMQVLKAVGIEGSLGDRLVFGSNVRQVLDYVERGEVAAGIVYATDAKQSGDKVKVVTTADAATHEPIVYPGVVIKTSKHAAAAKGFLDFLGSEKGRALLTARGFATAAGGVAPASRPTAPEE